ncbi:MAG: DUF899 domain-containing protein [Solirubrobacterales bacterium]
MKLPPVVSQAEWEAAHEELLAKEKEATRARDALAAERRRQPMVEFDTNYVFTGPDGQVRLLDLFDGRRQLIVYHFMWESIEDPNRRCNGCSMVVDNLGHPAHLNARDTTLVLVSRNAPPAEIEEFKERMGWTVPWFSDDDGNFSAACGITRFFGLSVFLRDGDRVLRTYSTTGRGVEAIGTNWTLLDLTPLGRQEDWENSPEGYPQTPRYGWWQMHDEYDDVRETEEATR